MAQQQTTADFYLANGLIRTRLDVKPTFDRRFSVPAAEGDAMIRTPFFPPSFLQLSGGLALAGVSLPLWAHDMADMAGGDAHPALRLPEPTRSSWRGSTKARYAPRAGRRRRAAEDIQ